jgi:hypothetical protein
MQNMDIWNAVARPPKTVLKQITAGRIKGKSDINPQWRYQIMSEQFGMCGVGWKFTIDRLWTEPGDKGVVFAFAQISVYVKVDGVWSDAIPGVGGHQLLEDEAKGLHNNDEAFKMATTDALGVAMKMLGVAAEVYLGNFDGSKYKTDPPESAQPAFTPPAKTEPAKLPARTTPIINAIGKARKMPDPVAAEAELNRIWAKAQGLVPPLAAGELEEVQLAGAAALADLKSECAEPAK